MSNSTATHGRGKAALIPREEVVDYIFKLFKERGDAAYVGEPVSQTEHALQAAWAAEKAGASDALIAAALLHDIGHLLHDMPENIAEQGVDTHHEDLGGRWLERYFPPEVTQPIELHVAAKRYMCAIMPGYYDKLSDASKLSLKLQGGQFTENEVKQFRAGGHADAAVALRHWDDEAKIQNLKTPELGHFRRYVEASLIRGKP